MRLRCPGLLLLAVLLCPGLVFGEENRITLPVRINDQELNFIFDTGSEAVLLFRHAADRLGLKLTPPSPDAKLDPGKTAVHTSEPVTFVFAEHRVANLSLMVMEDAPGGDIDFDGVIGWPQLQENIHHFNGVTRNLSMIDKVPAEATQWTRLKILRDWTVLTLELPQSREGQPALLGIDSGSSHGVRLAPKVWHDWRAAHPKAPVTLESYFTPGAGLIVAEVAWAEEIDLAGLKLTKVEVSEMNLAEANFFPPDAPPFAVAGMAGLCRLDLILDNHSGTGYARLLDSPPPANPHNRLGAVFVPLDPYSSEDLVAHVVPGSPAALAGIKAGDVLLKVDDLDVTPWRTQPGILPLARFWEQPPGTKLRLTVRRGHKTHSVLVVLRNILGEVGPPVNGA